MRVVVVALRICFFNDPATPEIYTLSLHDALPIYDPRCDPCAGALYIFARRESARGARSEEHTSELQSRRDLVCRLLLEKKKKQRGWRRPSGGGRVEPRRCGDADSAGHERQDRQQE